MSDSEVSKRISIDDEEMIEELCEKHGLNVMPVTYWNVYNAEQIGLDGPSDSPVIPHGWLCSCVTRGEVACFLAGVDADVEKGE